MKMWGMSEHFHGDDRTMKIRADGTDFHGAARLLFPCAKSRSKPSGMQISRAFVGVAMVALAAGCVSGSKGLSSDDKERLKAYISDTEPAGIPHKIDINFENKIHLVGYKVDPERSC